MYGASLSDSCDEPEVLQATHPTLTIAAREQAFSGFFTIARLLKLFINKSRNDCQLLTPAG
jgi:hypothetical protein